MKSVVLAAAVTLTLTGAGYAQQSNEHEGHHPGGAPSTAPSQPQPAAPSAPPASSPVKGGVSSPTPTMPGMSGDQMNQMGQMMGMMRKMMPMMEGMQKPDMSPDARAQMMGQMAPMMQQMMPMMQQMMGGMQGTAAQPAAPANAGMPPHGREYMEAMDKMHGPMAKAASVADPDEAFVRGMIPHHQAAIDMARAALKYGKDEGVRKWANDVIREQQREITEMEAWLKKNTK